MAKEQHILLVGATGFTGKQTLRLLAEKIEKSPINIHCYTRKESVPELLSFIKKHHLPTPHIIEGTLEDTTAFTEALEKVDGLIYTASLGFDYAKDIVKCCETAKIKRAVFISSTAIFTQLNATSKEIRQAAEKRIVESKLAWTILRPTMIYGRKGDRNMERLVRYITKFMVLFIPGGGNNLQQPIFVDDVAGAVVDAYFCKKAHKKAYNISGADALTFKNVVSITAELLNKRTFAVPLPLKPVCFLVRGYEKLCALIHLKPKIKQEQLLRLNEDKAFEHSDAMADFDFAPITFKAGMSILIQELYSK